MCATSNLFDDEDAEVGELSLQDGNEMSQHNAQVSLTITARNDNGKVRVGVTVGRSPLATQQDASTYALYDAGPAIGLVVVLDRTITL